MRRKIKRLHSEDARLLRAMVLDLHDRLNELESAMGAIQRDIRAIIQPDGETEILDGRDLAEVLSV